MFQEKLFKVGGAGREHHLVSSKTTSFRRQRDIGEALIGEETSEDFEQVAGVVVPLEAELVMERHVHQKDLFHSDVNSLSISVPYYGFSKMNGEMNSN